MGEARWKTTKVWPPREAREERWYLRPAGDLGPEAPPADGAAADYHVDFALTTGAHNRWATNNGAGDVVYGDRAVDADRMLIHTSAPLPRDLEVTGQPVVTLHLAASREDAAVFVYLTDVAPDGRVRYVGEGQLRALHRAVSTATPAYTTVGPYRDFKRANGRAIVPGEPVELVFEMHPLSVLFRAGHRIRLEIAGADAGTFARVPAAGPLELTLFRDAARPSSITLPIIPSSDR